MVVDALEDGPLYFRGVRNGDQLMSLTWRDREGILQPVVSEPAAMLVALQQMPSDTLVKFQWSRQGRPREEFQSLPAWQPMATLFVDQDREWAFWTPAGFYDASINGHQRFGWQINRGIEALPEFFRADQFRARLERPQVMRQLLRTGSLPQAMRAAVAGVAPAPGETALLQQIEMRPKIRVLEPQDGVRVSDDELLVKAEVTLPRGASLRSAKVFANGVPAYQTTIDDQRSKETAAVQVIPCSWRVRLPHDRNINLEVIAAADLETSDRVSLQVTRTEQAAAPKTAPQLYVLAIGTNEYRDRQIPGLDFAARGATEVTRIFQKNSAGIYQVQATELLNKDAVRPLWRVVAEEAARQLKARVGPDDLVVMYLVGHGLRDRRTDQWYFVTSDARYQDLMNDRYDDCIAFSDLAALAALPCRKLAILDTCHSGAVQPALDTSDLKAVQRLLQNDLIFTLTASEGEEEAAEERERQLGRFTSRLIEALGGEADRTTGNRDGEVNFQETIAYVQRTVAEDAQARGVIQHPTAAPAYLLQQLELPLTKAR